MVSHCSSSYGMTQYLLILQLLFMFVARTFAKVFRIATYNFTYFNSGTQSNFRNFLINI